MSEERLKFLGRRSELELKKKNLALRIEGQVNSMRDALDPLKPIQDLRTDRIVSAALDLADSCDRHREVMADLQKISDILGR